ncbi:ammonium transporter [Archangium violaceum]|nr:ammonium transporter [Archangium violaceum]
MSGGIVGADVAWVLVASALVMLMVPGLALFYGGMVQGKNVLSTLMHSFGALAVVTVVWALWGYSLAFGESQGGLIGGATHLFMKGVGQEAKGTLPHILFFLFQGTFAAITPALISGAYAERLKFSAFLLFTVLWATFVYAPVAHWVWAADGWLLKLGALDFAGGAVVHLTSGVSALVVALVVGRRKGARQPPHNLAFTLLGAGLLWFGWFGFNAGSALAANELAAVAATNTHLAAAAGAVAWGIVDLIRLKKVTALGAASGLVAGLVGITPAAGFVAPMGALAIGLLAGAVCYGGVLLKEHFRYDDALDVVGVHGVGGALGALLTGVFATVAVNPAGADGVLAAGNWALLGKQALSILAVAAFSALLTFVLLKVVQAVVGLRVDDEAEFEGLDPHVHGERAYHTGMSLGSGHGHGSSAPREVPSAQASASEKAPLSAEPAMEG